MWEMVFFSLGRADKGEGEVLMGSRVWQGEFSVKDLVCTTWLVNHVLITRVFFSFRSGRGGVRQSPGQSGLWARGCCSGAGIAALSAMPKTWLQPFKARPTLVFDSGFNLDLNLCFKF